MTALTLYIITVLAFISCTLCKKDVDNLPLNFQYGIDHYLLSSREKSLSSSEPVPSIPSRPFNREPLKAKLKKDKLTQNQAPPSFSFPNNSNNNVTASECPSRYNAQFTNYTAGDTVEVNHYIFQCNGDQYEKYCNIAVFDISLIEENENAESLWLNSWSVVGECERTARPTGAPTSSPSLIPSASPSSSSSKSAVDLGATTNKPSAPIVSKTNSPSITPTSDPIPPKCTKSQTRIRIELLTDGFPRDTSWEFVSREDTTNKSDGGLLLKSREYGVRESDIREVCVEEGEYEFTIYDEFEDGICCAHGDGYYKLLTLDENDTWRLLVAGAQFGKEVRHNFVIDKDTVDMVCKSSQRKITIDFQTDLYGADLSWAFRAKDGYVIAKSERKYGSKESDTRDLCVEDGALYEFVVDDEFGDGMCCAYGEF